ncbi:MAG: efflux RND transporter periplasmic adaptor subunit [Bacteroidales bacterium]|nr:efflux RND transporter periplasmic adaptor subunit [Bacteroidales bacterium]
MDIQIPKKKFYVKYKFHLAGATLLIALLCYMIIASLGPAKLRIDSEEVKIGEAVNDKFMEYVDVEGVIQPILTIRVNARERGSVKQIVAEEGAMLKTGDTILVLDNPDLLREIEDQQDEWHKTLMSYKEKELEMEQKSLNLKQQTMKASYELSRLRKSFELDKEEFKMGVKSKAQLDVSQDDYEYNLKNTALQLESLRHDSAMTIINRQLLKDDQSRAEKKYLRSNERIGELVIRAPYSGQLSFVNVVPGQQIGTGESVGEIKVLDQFKIRTSLSEFYIDRITNGLPGSINYQEKKYPVHVTKVVPEVKNRMFDIDLVFNDSMPDNVRIGKNYRVQVELGQPEQVLVIPKGNFFQATSGEWIFKLTPSGDKAVRQKIVIGRQNPLQYEILEGLKPGDKVIVTGYDKFGDVQELVL